MTKTVTDTAVMLDGMAGFDSSDPATAESLGNIPKEGYTSQLDTDDLEGARLGVIREYIEDDPEETGVEAGQPLVVAELIESAIDDLEAAGATIIDSVTIPDLNELVGEGYITGFEFERDLNEYLDELGGAAPVDTQQEILESETIEGGIIERFRASRDIDVETLDENVEYLSGLRARQTLRENLFFTMAENELDAFIYPTASRTPAEIGADRPSGINTTLSPVAAFPSITVPAGYTSETELPVGLEFLGRPFEEPLLLGLAYSYEQATMLRHPPEGFGSLSEN
jgi:Asp-tRNA(Asn)/Glu-tRNA(Gln) amidotransferase A subunit family amidase